MSGCMETDNTIQILLSTYNGAKYLLDQLNSFTCLDEHQNIKILIRDDGSTDNTREILRKYRNDKRFEILYGEHIGINASYEVLLRRSDANCRYFAFSDQDDVWLHDKLTLAQAMLGRYDDQVPLLFASRSRLVDKELKSIGETPRLRHLPSFYNAMVQNICPGHTQVFNRKLRMLLLQGTFTKACVLDWWVYLIASGTGKVLFSEECTVLHRQHSQNTVGYLTNPFRLLCTRIKRLRAGETTRLTKQLEGLWECYALSLSKDYRKELEYFLNSQETIQERLHYALTGKVFRQTLCETILVRLLYACGKYKMKD